MICMFKSKADLRKQGRHGADLRVHNCMTVLLRFTAPSTPARLRIPTEEPKEIFSVLLNK